MIQFFGGKTVFGFNRIRDLFSILNKSQRNFCTYTKPVYKSSRIFHRLDINALSDKWFVDFSYNGSSLGEEEKKIRPSPFGKVFFMTLIQQTMMYVKGRPQYRIQFTANDLSRLASWSPQYGKFDIVRSSEYKQQVITIQKVIKTQPTAKPHMFVALFKRQQFPLTLYRFHFYNNKITEEKSKEFFMTEPDFMLLKQTIKNGHQWIVGHQYREQYDIWNVQKQIIDKTMFINSQYNNQEQ